MLDSWRASLPPGARPDASIRVLRAATGAARATTSRRKVRSAPESAGTDVDFAIERLIGSGGMGMVYLAAQTSLNRDVALKTIAEAHAEDASRQASLREEALIAGQLDHPNIIPVYDLATDERGRLFYTMKRIRGKPWSAALPTQSLSERLEVFLRVCDALAFAHSRGVIHRDLKPSNVMLGAFGEVTVMDWGVACTVRGVSDPNALGDRAALCGTPAYMPPEMARGDAASVGCASDVYLLGAMLYELLEDRPPRGGPDALACVEQAAKNFIETPRRDDELTRVAMRAMATRPGDRCASVTDLQSAVRDCTAHLESIRLARSAEDASSEGAMTGTYAAHARAIFGFEQALAYWPENAAARLGLARARMAYARSALTKEDYELALSQLDPGEPSHANLRDEIETELAAHRLRRRRLRLFARATAGLAALLALGAAAFGWVVRGKNLVLRAQQTEIAQRLEEVRHSDRAGLITLLRSQHAAGEYEAAVATALRLREAYGFEWSEDPALRQLAREAAWMNPWRATLHTQVNRPRRLILTKDGADLFVVGESDIERVDPERMEVRELIPLPSPSRNSELVQVGKDGGLWCARGMDIFRRDGTNWSHVATVPRPPGHDHAESAITGLLVSRDDRRLAAGVDGVWLACRDSDISDHWRIARVADQSPAGSRDPAGAEIACIIRDSPTGQWLAWRPANNTSVAFIVEADPLRVRAWFYNRNSQIFDVAVRTEPLQLVAATFHGTIFRPDIDVAIQVPQHYAFHGWTPEGHGEWQTPLMDCAAAAWRPDGRDVVTANARGWIWVSSSDPASGRRMLLRTSSGAPLGVALDAGGQAYVLTTAGEIRKYDARLFSRRVISAHEQNPDQAPGERLSAFVEHQDGRWFAREPDAEGRMMSRELKMPGDYRIRGVALDPLGEYTIHATATDLWIQDRAGAIQRVPISFTDDGPIDLRFTPDGQHLIARQLWLSHFLLLRRGTWESLNPSDDIYSVGLYMTPRAGRMKVLIGGENRVACMDAATGAFEWTTPCEGPVRNLIPVPDGVYADGPSLWAGSYMGSFVRMSMNDGRAHERTAYWFKKLSKINIRMSDPSLPLTAILLPMRDGLVVAWNGDMLPITPDLLPGEYCSALSFSPGGSILLAHQHGRSVQFPMPRAADYPRMSALLGRLFGPDAADTRLTASEVEP
ncbi:MAG: serine/threonine protein kinase [Kiritimatiellae bacterium]|nr:serine/threonine protein kinase [Kiritimatiellia bacterium]